MKFSYGCWVQRKGTELFSPAEVYETKRDVSSITFLAPTHKIKHRGDTLGGPNLTIKISAPVPEVLRIQTYHYKGVVNHGPDFELNMGENSALSIEEDEKEYILSSGSLKVTVDKETAALNFYRGKYKLTSSKARDLAYVKTEFTGLAHETDTKDAYMREQLSLSVGELIYGLGERFTPFVKNGQNVEIWNEDGGTSTELSYKNIPFYLSGRGYGVFVNSTDKVSFEVSSEMVKKVGFSIPGESLDYFIFNGPTMKEALSRYTDLTGKPALPAPWTFGLWLSTSFTTNYDEATVTSFVDGMIEREIPLSVFHFDCFWMKGFQWSDFRWDKEVFSNPAGMLRRLKEKGLRICVWINSYIAQESVLFEEGMENGYFVKRTNGDVWQWDMWQPGMALVDFTNPRACEWFSARLEDLLDMGVDCFKTDFGERIPIQDVVYYNGADPVRMHNYYTYLYNKTVFDLLERKRGKKEAVLFARSATVGGQKFPVHWGGDCWSDFESMSESLRGGLSLTMSGFGFWSHDIGGFEDTSTPDVYKRWVAFGLMSSHSRLHGSSSYRVPWVYDEEAVDVARFFTKLKLSLMPYIYRNAIETSKTGIPTMRSMVLEFQEDPACGYLDKQYMFGDSLLIAPVFDEEGVVEYYVPMGNWTNYLTGEKIRGGSYRKEQHGYFSLPCLVRENTILAVGAKDSAPSYDYAKEVTFKIYELVEEKMAATKLYDIKADLELEISSLLTGNQIKITVNHYANKKPYKIYLHNIKNVTACNGGKYDIDSTGTFLIPDSSDMSMTEELVCILG
ncbi:alpha-xylosidase [Anaerocolumna cellulosilytica]|uniref:alpha-D-xyloside xylohydrolase n=1 Tax=Anaerocolumna cellulosilytica TaxID=433286 RepID=A0A6S6R9R3_9FIRM|nr:alpha-xylosidase [Anaerocolumna cellulosilytica]MBB5195343.1 alpha-D-xyloside xylohydrolase [Anaerocolumna cellulosilytica]BCJ95875.1 alpha-xylosidase [Anaerocolumna cellulosilytica]